MTVSFKNIFTIPLGVPVLTCAAVLSPAADARGQSAKTGGGFHAGETHHSAGTQHFPTEIKGSTKKLFLTADEYAAECNKLGGGASSDPQIGSVCRDPEGDYIIVPQE